MKKFVFALASVVSLAACSGNKTDVTAAGAQPPQFEAPAPTPVPQKGLQANPVDPGSLTAVDALTVQGYKFVLVATKNNVDQVLVNEEANNLEFQVGDAVCRTKILSKEDPTYPGEELGVLQVVCDSHGVKLTSSASCSPRYPEVQSHFEIADDQDNYVLDLVCRVKAQ